MPGENGNGAADAKQREVTRAELVRMVALAVAIGTPTAAIATWTYSIQVHDSNQDQVITRMAEFMDETTRARRDQGTRERQRREFCAQGVLKGNACLFLLSDSELSALER